MIRVIKRSSNNDEEYPEEASNGNDLIVSRVEILLFVLQARFRDFFDATFTSIFPLLQYQNYLDKLTDKIIFVC